MTYRAGHMHVRRAARIVRSASSKINSHPNRPSWLLDPCRHAFDAFRLIYIEIIHLFMGLRLAYPGVPIMKWILPSLLFLGLIGCAGAASDPNDPNAQGLSLGSSSADTSGTNSSGASDDSSDSSNESDDGHADDDEDGRNC